MQLQQLPGSPDRAEVIRHELRIGGIATAIANGHDGAIGPFEFTRHDEFWLVVGPLPLLVAEQLYADPDGRIGIRVQGYPGNQAPAFDHVEWLTPDGTLVLPTLEESGWKIVVERQPSLQAKFDQLIFSDDPGSHGAKPFITRYHIDTLLGLVLFANAIRQHCLQTTTQVVPNVRIAS